MKFCPECGALLVSQKFCSECGCDIRNYTNKETSNDLGSFDFESLQELVDSARYKIKKNLASGNPKEEYTKIDLGKLNDLKAEVDSYAMVLNLPDEEDSYEEYEDDWEEEL